MDSEILDQLTNLGRDVDSEFPKPTQLPWQPGQNLNNSFFFSHIESISGMEVPWHDKHQPTTLLLW